MHLHVLPQKGTTGVNGKRVRMSTYGSVASALLLSTSDIVPSDVTFQTLVKSTRLVWWNKRKNECERVCQRGQ